MSLLPLVPAILELVDKFFPTDSDGVAEKKIELKTALLNAASAQDTAQNEVNKVEAANTDRFVSGWRPFIGWICGFAFLYAFVLQDIVNYFLILQNLPLLPVIDTGDLMSIMLGMLGLGGLRTYEKIKGVTK